MSKFYINDDLRHRANDKQPPTEDKDDDTGLNRRPQNSKQLPSQAVQEEDVPSEITLNENNPLLIFLRSQESCIKGCVGEFYTWLVTSEDIDSMELLMEAVIDDDYLNEKMKVGNGRDFGVRGFKLQLFKRAVLDHDNTKAPVAAADSTDAKIAELGDKVDNNEEAVVKLEDKVDKENSHQYKVNDLLFENMKKDREQADEKHAGVVKTQQEDRKRANDMYAASMRQAQENHAASMKTSELLQEAIVAVNNKIDKNKKKQDDWNEKQDAKVNKMKKKQNQLVKSVKKIERALRLSVSPLGKKAKKVKKRLSFKPKSGDDSDEECDANDSSIASDTSSVPDQSENGEESSADDSDASSASFASEAVNVEEFDAKEEAASPKSHADV